VATCHSIGYAALKRKYGNFELDEYKMHKIFDKKAAKWRLLKLPEDSLLDWFGRYKNDMIQLINLCRSTLSLEKKYICKLIDSYELNLNQTVDVKRVLDILSTAYEDTTVFDFTDMVYMAAIEPSIFFFKLTVSKLSKEMFNSVAIKFSTNFIILLFKCCYCLML